MAKGFCFAKVLAKGHVNMSKFLLILYVFFGVYILIFSDVHCLACQLKCFDLNSVQGM